MINIELAMLKDLGHLCNLELKSQDSPLDIEYIRSELLNLSTPSYLARIGDTFVGHTLAHLIDDTVFVKRVSVHPLFRGLGVGTELVKSLENTARNHKAKVIKISAPSYKIDDKLDPDYIGGWFTKLGFKAVTVLHRLVFRYGEYWDVYVFEKEV